MPITRIVVLTDNDQAGREAKIQIQRQLNRMYKLIQDAQTIIPWVKHLLHQRKAQFGQPMQPLFGKQSPPCPASVWKPLLSPIVHICQIKTQLLKYQTG